MDTERNQADLIRHYVNEATSLTGSSLTALIVDATSNPNLFVFSEILSVPSVALLEGTEQKKNVDLLRLFAFGTWSDYRHRLKDTENAGSFVPLVPEQVLKLKQLTVLSATANCKVLHYDILMPELDISTVRELEDFLIDSCISAGIVTGKLNQSLGCIEVDYAAARDPIPNKLQDIFAFLSSWSFTADKLIATLQENITRAKGKEEEVQENIKLTNGKEDEVQETNKQMEGKEEEDEENQLKKLQSHERQASQEDEQPSPKRMRQKTR